MKNWRRPGWASSLTAALPGWLLARLLVGVGAVVAIVITDKLTPGRRTLQLRQGLFSWDAAFYRDLAQHGYDHVAREGLRFFPLLPVAARELSVPLFGDIGLALILLVNLAALVAGALLHRLSLEELGDQPTAARAAWLLALLPPATVLIAGYAEALLLAFSIGAFLALRRRQWWVAAALGVLAGLCRPVGLVLALPAAIEAARDLRETTWPERFARASAVVAPLLGTASYLAWVQWQRGDWLLPFRLQNTAELRGGMANPISVILHAVRSVGNGGGLGEALHLPWIALFAFLLWVCWRRLPASYTAYAGALLLFALTGHTLGSFERYGLAAFPLVLALAIVLRRPRDERIAIALCAAGLTAFATLELLGAFVP